MVCLSYGQAYVCLCVSPHVCIEPHMREGVQVHDIYYEPKFYKLKLLGKSVL